MSIKAERDKLQREIAVLQDEVDAAELAQEDNAIQIEATRIIISILTTNIRILKADKIVAVLSEYKKAREEKEQAIKHLVTLMNTSCTIDSYLAVKRPKLEMLLSDYKTLKLDTGNVIKFRGTKHG